LVEPDVLIKLSDGALAFWCPGCRSHHSFDSRWSFNGDMVKPTFSPSLKVGPCWNTPKGWEPEFDSEGNTVLAPDGIHVKGAIHILCHSFVRDGNIEFLSDCSHALAGKTVALLPMDGPLD